MKILRTNFLHVSYDHANINLKNTNDVRLKSQWAKGQNLKELANTPVDALRTGKKK